MSKPAKMVTAFGSFYVRADQAGRDLSDKRKKRWEPPKLKDLIEVMQRQPVSVLFVNGLLQKLAKDLKGAELVESGHEVFVSIASDLYEILIASTRDEQQMSSIVVEKLQTDGACRVFGSVEISAESTYGDILDKVKKFVERAKA